MPSPPERIYQVCADLLDVLVARHGGSLPARQYIAAGAPAWDCALLATWCEATRGSSGDPTATSTTAQSASPAWALRAGTFVATLVRCVPLADVSPTGELLRLPTEAEESAAAAELYTDATRMLDALVAGYKAGELGACHGLAFLDWRSIGPAGGMVAGELRVAIALTAA